VAVVVLLLHVHDVVVDVHLVTMVVYLVVAVVVNTDVLVVLMVVLVVGVREEKEKETGGINLRLLINDMVRMDLRS
jgi:hypothetical protein